MTKVSERLNRLSESATLAMARMSRELKAQGHDVIALPIHCSLPSGSQFEMLCNRSATMSLTSTVACTQRRIGSQIA